MPLEELDHERNAVYAQERCYMPRRPYAHRRSSQMFGTAHLEGSYLHEHGYLGLGYGYSLHDFLQVLWMNFQLLDEIH